MIPILFQIGPLPLFSFGFLIFLAFVAASRRLSLSLAGAGENAELADSMIFWAAVGGIVGARINYLISFPEFFAEHGLSAIYKGAGFVFYGGFIGGALAVWILLKRNKVDFFRFADLSGPALALGYAIGRIGCQLSGDGDYGAESTLPWAMSYVLGVVPTDPGVLVHPAPVYETLASLLITGILLSSAVQGALRKRGQLFGLYLLLMAIERFGVEFVRVEPVISFGLTQAQIVACGIAVLALPLLLGAAHKNSAAENENSAPNSRVTEGFQN